MAPIFSMEITDFKKEITQVNITNHCIWGGCSAKMRSKVVLGSRKSLKYFDKEADSDINKIQSKVNDSNLEMKYFDYNPYKLFVSYRNKVVDCYPRNRIETSRSCLSKIMNTPFEINGEKRKWIITAKSIRKESIHLYYEETKKTDNKTLTEKYELLKNHFFVKIPISHYRKVKTIFSEVFIENRQINVDGHEVIFCTEIPGIVSDKEIQNIQELRSAEHVYLDIFKSGEFTKEVIDYNPIWWSKATLINAKQCIIAAYDYDNDCIEDIIKFDIDKFEDKSSYENLWSPTAAWNFLSDFLRFVKDSVNSVSEDIKDKCEVAGEVKPMSPKN
ncbi:hypothetical protein O3M35_002499 [Rhynocoris fuscipes]|uniref:Uncharacterized protein n=1 Tax=Rhynocoris fuscipes TaxID=488301 RepID=A0AAW1CKJ1_9HEMI